MMYLKSPRPEVESMKAKYPKSLKENLPTLESRTWGDPMQNLAKKLKYFRNPLYSIPEIGSVKRLPRSCSAIGGFHSLDENRRRSTGSSILDMTFGTLGSLTGSSDSGSPQRRLSLCSYSTNTTSRTDLSTNFDAQKVLQKIYAAPKAFEGLWLANTIPPGRSGINKDLSGLSLVEILRCLNLVLLTPLQPGTFSDSHLLLYDVTANQDKALLTRYLENHFQRVQRSNLIRELKIWSRLSHDNCVRLFGVFQIDMKVHFIVEVSALHTLEHYINSRLHRSVKEIDAQRLVWSAARGLHYLHRHGIVHRDLRPSKLVLGSNFQLKIAGFSKAVKLTTGGYSLCLCGKLPFRPPEMFTETEFDLYKVDVWALGIIGFYILMQALPFPRSYVDVSTLLWPVEKTRWPHTQLSYSFLNCLLEPDPALRPTAVQVLYHKWIHRNTKS